MVKSTVHGQDPSLPRPEHTTDITLAVLPFKGSGFQNEDAEQIGGLISSLMVCGNQCTQRDCPGAE